MGEGEGEVDGGVVIDSGFRLVCERWGAEGLVGVLKKGDDVA